MRRRFVVVLLVSATSLAAACGLPDDRQPRIISAADAPLDLGESQDGSTTAAEGDDAVELFFVRDGLLDSVMREAPDGELGTAIELLLAGPAENEAFLSTSIPPETELISATVDGTTAILDLGCRGDVPVGQCGVLGVGASEQLTLFAQLVCTATDVSGVEAVRFLQEGEAQDAPTDSGTTQSPTPVTCEDYQTLQR